MKLEVVKAEEKEEKIAEATSKSCQSESQAAFEERFRKLRELEGMGSFKRGRRPAVRPLHEDLWRWLEERRPLQYLNRGADGSGSS